jgi:hypothetical protein
MSCMAARRIRCASPYTHRVSELFCLRFVRLNLNTLAGEVTCPTFIREVRGLNFSRDSDFSFPASFPP